MEGEEDREEMGGGERGGEEERAAVERVGEERGGEGKEARERRTRREDKRREDRGGDEEKEGGEKRGGERDPSGAEDSKNSCQDGSRHTHTRNDQQCPVLERVGSVEISKPRGSGGDISVQQGEMSNSESLHTSPPGTTLSLCLSLCLSLSLFPSHPLYISLSVSHYLFPSLFLLHSLCFSHTHSISLLFITCHLYLDSQVMSYFNVLLYFLSLHEKHSTICEYGPCVWRVISV